jgi:restriction system protein
VVKELGADWTVAYKIPPERWEEIVAGRLQKNWIRRSCTYTKIGRLWSGRDRDQARRRMSENTWFRQSLRADHLVPYDAVRALIGVITGEQNTSKGIITTTSDFPPRIGITFDD